MTTVFNLNPPRFLHIDLNSCFASIEQQANPGLRGKPVVVGAYTTDNGCILAASREAKKMGVKTGMRIWQAKKISSRVIVLPSDPEKYRFVSGQLLEVFQKYTPDVEMKSIDEAILDFSAFRHSGKHALGVARPESLNNTIERSWTSQDDGQNLWDVALKIKQDIKINIGEWLTVSVGISTNSYLAKAAAGLQKPDGLVQIDSANIKEILGKLQLEDLPYIKRGNRTRLNCVGIYTCLEFYQADAQTLKRAFMSVVGARWWSWLHGFEIEGVTFGGRVPGVIDKTIGHSYALSKPTNDDQELASLLCQLVEKMGRRLRAKGFLAGGIHIYCNLEGGSFWHHGEKLPVRLFESTDLFKAAWKVFSRRSKEPKVTLLAVNVFDLELYHGEQMSFFTAQTRKKELAAALDTINNRFGEWSIFSALSLGTRGKIHDRIAFGKLNGRVT